MILTIHSVVDVITNSSTVIYTIASKSTIDAIKKLINGLLDFTTHWRRRIRSTCHCIHPRRSLNSWISGQ